MPNYRLLHENARTGRRTKQLTDLEYLVWLAYLLSADDYGVCPYSARKLQGDDPRLDTKSTKMVDRCLGVLVEVGLLFVFEDGGGRYLYQSDWQDWQKIRYPSTTSYPPVPSSEFARLSAKTVAAFQERSRVRSENVSDRDDTLSTANANARSSSSDLQKDRERFDRLWFAYPRKVGKEAAWRKWLALKPDDALTGAMIEAVQAQSRSPQWMKDGGQFIPHPATWLNQGRWQDEAPVDLMDAELEKFRPKGA